MRAVDFVAQPAGPGPSWRCRPLRSSCRRTGRLDAAAALPFWGTGGKGGKQGQGTSQADPGLQDIPVVTPSTIIPPPARGSQYGQYGSRSRGRDQGSRASGGASGGQGVGGRGGGGGGASNVFTVGGPGGSGRSAGARLTVLLLYLCWGMLLYNLFKLLATGVRSLLRWWWGLGPPKAQGEEGAKRGSKAGRSAAGTADASGAASSHNSGRRASWFWGGRPGGSHADVASADILIDGPGMSEPQPVTSTTVDGSRPRFPGSMAQPRREDTDGSAFSPGSTVLLYAGVLSMMAFFFII